VDQEQSRPAARWEPRDATTDRDDVDRSDRFRDYRSDRFQDDRPDRFQDDRSDRFQDDRSDRFQDDRSDCFQDDRPDRIRDDRSWRESPARRSAPAEGGWERPADQDPRDRRPRPVALDDDPWAEN
jgi:hypothetical protein